MDPRHLVQLATIVDTGSMSKASKHLHLTQPTLTHNMQTLEMQAGGLLFERSRLGVRHTPLGETLAREGRAIARQLKNAQEASARHRQGLHQQVRIGTGALIGAVLLPMLSHHLLAGHPELSITMRGERPHLLLDQLVDGEHDMILGPSTIDRPPEGIERFLLIDDELGVFCGAAHPLAGIARPDPGLDVAQHWISLGDDSPYTRDVQEMLAEAGMRRVRTEISVTGEVTMLLRILAEGRHLAVLPCFPTRALSRWFPLVQLPLEAKRRPRKLYLWCRTELLDDPIFVAARQALEAIVETS